MTRHPRCDAGSAPTPHRMMGVVVSFAVVLLMLVALLSSLPSMHLAIGVEGVDALDQGVVLSQGTTQRLLLACVIAIAINLSGLAWSTATTARRDERAAASGARLRPLAVRYRRARLWCGGPLRVDDEPDSCILTHRTSTPSPGVASRYPGVFVLAVRDAGRARRGVRGVSRG
ncbi:MAG: hypothetical protein U1E08_05770 [Coriobacteriia bacterium]|nr:hypothetical protein [Coriobacteriia bacterium]